MYVHVMSSEEVEQEHARMDAWWSSLDWNIKYKLGSLVDAVRDAQLRELREGPMIIQPDSPLGKLWGDMDNHNSEDMITYWIS